MKILIVDDDIVDRKIIIRALGGANTYREIVETNSVSSGLAALAQSYYDVILLDYKMPEADGIEMLYDLRSRKDLGDTAVIMVSASEEIELALQCIEAGAQDFLAKSEVTQDKLSKAIIHAQKRFEVERKMHDSYIAVKKMAERDGLTGLSNRYHFEEILKVMIANNKRSKNMVALLALDIDNFKHINDTLGHDTGDKLLVMLVNKVRECLRRNEGFARVGGDEFAIILGGVTTANEISVISDRILNKVAAPFLIADNEVYCTVSIGIAMFPADAATPELLTKYANIAMYRAKRNGKNQVCYYESQYQNEFNRRYSIQTLMSNHLKQQNFHLHFQASFNKNNKINGFEALMRWPDVAPHYRPDEFIPVAEETQQINDIGKWVLNTALRQLAKWQLINPLLTIAVNVSPVQLRDNDFILFVQALLITHKIEAQMLTLEITETVFFKDKDKIANNLLQLSQMGIKIALDDFGMGYSSISHLMNYPIDIVKIDKSLQTQDGAKQINGPILEALTLMLQKLNFTIVAEGIETESQLALCKTLEIDEIQGYLLSRPVGQVEAEKLLIKNLSA
jgi:diguanylate cyclase (GGDEF)-like protein